MSFDHPQVGELLLNREKLLVGGTDNITLVIYDPGAGTDAEEKLALLTSATLTARATTLEPTQTVTESSR
jgi:MmyB-like transcription regulator ligand binding domain